MREDIDAFADDVRKTSRLLQLARTGKLSPHALGRYLRSIHYLLLHTPIHLSLAERCAIERGHPDLARYFALKRDEETGHDRWAEADIARLTDRFGVVVPEDPMPAMKVLVDANASTIRENPVLYLAYILFAEYFMVVIGPEWLRAVREKCGVPESLMSAIGNHVELDQDHVEEGCAEIDTLVDVRCAREMREALRGMTRRFSAFCDELCEP
jgi:hypothetical protein